MTREVYVSENDILNEISNVLVRPKDLAPKLGLNQRYLTKRLTHLVKEGKIERCVDFRVDARSMAYRRKSDIVIKTVTGVTS